jgi:soluble lytic murein transglycosylase
LPSKARKALYAVAGAAASLLALSAVADAQTTTTDDPNLGYDPRKFPKPLELVTAPPVVMRQPLSDSDAANLNQALESAKRGDLTGARTAIALINDPLGRKIGTWAFVDVASDQLSAFEIDQARRDLAGWPRAARRQAAAEKLLETSGQSPQQIINWFGGDQPATAQGAMALAAAYRATGERAQADRVIRKAWREKMFEADVQRSMLARFGDCLSQEDHIRRLDMILYGQQGPAARDMLDLVPADWQALGRARIALRSGQGGAMELASSVPASVQNNAGLAFERAAFYRRRGLDTLALGLVSSFPSETYNS